MSQFTKNYSIIYLKNCHYALKNMGLISGIRKIPDPGVNRHGSRVKRHRIRDQENSGPRVNRHRIPDPGVKSHRIRYQQLVTKEDFLYVFPQGRINQTCLRTGRCIYVTPHKDHLWLQRSRLHRPIHPEPSSP
jgi:hypothetical protein